MNTNENDITPTTLIPEGNKESTNKLDIIEKIKNKANTLALWLALGATPLTMDSCSKDRLYGTEVVTPVEYKEYTYSPQADEVYFLLPDGSKISVPNLVTLAVKENMSNGSKDVALQFEGGKLRTEVKKILDGIKSQYPSLLGHSIRLKFSKISVDGTEEEFAATLGFTEKYESGSTGVGLDQLQDGQILNWTDLVRLAGGTTKTSGTTFLRKGEIIQATARGVVKTPDFAGYTSPTVINFKL